MPSMKWVEESRERPSGIPEYFLTKKKVQERGIMDALERHCLDEYNAADRTARLLKEKGFAVIGAEKLHGER